jgi:hypothetical protein
MQFVVTEQNNFCRVFKVPVTIHESFCFAGPIDIKFGLVDWFNPCFLINENEKEVSEESLYNDLKPFIEKKPYYGYGKLLVLCDFGAAFIIN